MKRFLVLDALRYVLALCVAIGHMEVFPLFGLVGQPDTTLDFLARVLRTIVYGPAAVIAFFVISGFCIHYPFAERKAVCPIGRFYARRYLRILVPVVGTVVLFKVLMPETVIAGNNSILWKSTLWSIVCEEIYYALYPMLNRLHRRFGWTWIIGFSFVCALMMTAFYFPAVDWQDIGILATTVALFPVWLLGCHLAEHISSLTKEYSVREIWLYRFGAWFVMWAGLMLHSHSPLHQTATGLWIGVAYYFWIRAELCYYRTRTPSPLLVWGGHWSYSLYLIHPLVIGICFRLGIQPTGSYGRWILVLAVVLLCSYLFYLVVERPSHQLARKVPLFPRSVEPLATGADGRIKDLHYGGLG